MPYAPRSPRLLALLVVAGCCGACVDVNGLRARITCDPADASCAPTQPVAGSAGNAGGAGGSGSGCENECVLGSGACIDDLVVRTCIMNAQGCRVLGEPRSCADLVPCTSDRCDRDLGRCENRPDDAQCPTTASGACARDYCDPARGCSVENRSASCDDHEDCTLSDACEKGVCAGIPDATRAECKDLCPDDSAKIAPLLCGCGVAEASGDSDADGTIDCLDTCPADECTTTGTTCVYGSLRTCTADAQGCKTRFSYDCDNMACFDATHCSSIDAFGWAQGEQVDPRAIVADAQGNAFVASNATSSVDGNPFGGNRDIALTKFNASGDRLWTSQWSGLGSSVQDLAINAAGDRIAIVGGATEDIWFGVWSATGRGDPLWTRSIQGQGQNSGLAIEYGPGGGLYVAGELDGPFEDTTPQGAADAYLMRVDPATGATVWTRRWGTGDLDRARGLASDADHVYVVGSIGRIGETADAGVAFLIQYDANGVYEWESRWDNGKLDEAIHVALTPDGTMFVAGSTGAYDEGGFLAKLLPPHSEQWSNAHQYPGGFAVDAAGNTFTGWNGDVLMNGPYDEPIFRNAVVPSAGVVGLAVTTAPGGVRRLLVLAARPSSTGTFAVLMQER